MQDDKENISNRDCVVHDHPVPPEQISRYSPIRDFDTEQDIARYVELEADDEKVQHVEKIKDEIVLGEHYDIWDVVTDKNRWWVIGNITNLYSQKSFPSLDYTLSFHIGLMMRLRERNARGINDDHAPFDEIWRRQEQARQQYDRAIEPEEFQAIGLQLRECLLSLVAAIRRRTTTPGDVPYPKDADFVGWIELLMNVLCRGGSNKQLRQYMKTIAKETWQLANWLAHDRDANSAAASIAIHSCDTLVGHSIQLFVRDKTDKVRTCPQCKSRDVRSHFDHKIGSDGEYYSTCGACGWSNHPDQSDADQSE
jgi:hypothetical protein